MQGKCESNDCCKPAVPTEMFRRNNIMSNTTIHEEFINDKARRQLFRPYQPSSGHNVSCHPHRLPCMLAATWKIGTVSQKTGNVRIT
jgi:hypothetical protein